MSADHVYTVFRSISVVKSVMFGIFSLSLIY